MSVHIPHPHLHLPQHITADTWHWLRKHMLGAACTAAVVIVAGLLITSLANQTSHPIGYLTSFDGISTCNAIIAVRKVQENGLSSSSSTEVTTFDRTLGTATRLSIDGVTEQIKIDNGVAQLTYAADGTTSNDPSSHSLEQLKRMLRIDSMRQDKWKVVESTVTATGAPRFYRQYRMKSTGPMDKELFLVVSEDNRLTALWFQHRVDSTSPTTLTMIASFDMPVDMSQFELGGANPMANS